MPDNSLLSNIDRLWQAGLIAPADIVGKRLTYCYRANKVSRNSRALGFVLFLPRQWRIRMGSARNMTIGIPCPHCGKETEKTVAWLVIHNGMPCGHCGGVIDLQAGQTALRIQKLAEECARADEAAGKGGGLG
jgi:hypothetical protein